MRPRFARYARLVSLVCLLAVHTAHAGVVLTRDGREIHGDVTVEAPATVVVATAGAQQRIAISDVASVEFDNVPAPALGALPAPWRGADIGKVAQPGSVAFDGGAFQISAAGWGLWSGVDSCHFVYQELAGDGQIIARVPAYAKDARVSAGVMVRGSLDPSAPLAALMIDALRQPRFNTRPGNTFTLENKPALVADRPEPRWLRLTRTGTWVIAHLSDDGQSWKALGWKEIDIGQGKVLIGITAASRLNASLSQATLDRVRVIAGPVKTSTVPFSALLARGLVMSDGTSVPGTLDSYTAESATFYDARGALQTRPGVQVAWAVFEASFPDLLPLSSANGPGVLLKNGDYLGGEITGVGRGWVSVESVLFGPRSFEIEKDVVAIAFRTPVPWADAFHVRTRDGASRCAASLTVEGQSLKVGAASIPLKDVSTLVYVAKP
jgi:hypothetical protein